MGPWLGDRRERDRSDQRGAAAAPGEGTRTAERGEEEKPANAPPVNAPPVNVPPVNVAPVNVPPVNAPPVNAPPHGYDPLKRTFEELRTDSSPAQRVGETIAQARARTHAAETELLRRAPALIAALGEAPREVNPRFEDPALAPEGAHTTGLDGRHGSDISLRHSDNPGGRTIEGRIFGDPPGRAPSEHPCGG